MKKATPVLRKAIFEVVENQLRDNTPPETRQAYERLVAEGISEGEAKRLIGVVLAVEIYDMLKSKKQYNETRFVALLKQLPKLPFDEGDE
jgi:uncharacterized protein YoaH (UPF0181 family)